MFYDSIVLNKKKNKIEFNYLSSLTHKGLIVLRLGH